MSGGGADRRPTTGELEALLGDWPLPAPPPELEARLRRVFGGGESPSRLEVGDRTDPVETMNVERLLSRSMEEPPRPEFREALRTAFCNGSLTGDARSARTGSRPVRRRLRPVAALLGLAAAAAAVLLGFLLTRADEPAWRLVSPVAGAELRVDSVLVPADALAANLDGHLGNGPRVEVGAAPVDLEFRGIVRLELRPGAVLRPLAVGDSDDLHVELTDGEVYLQTLPGHRGSPITVATPHGRVRLTGTALGVLAYSGGTCVCVARGTVEVTCHEGPGGGCKQEVHGGEIVRLADGDHFGPPAAFGENASDPHVSHLLAFVEGQATGPAHPPR